MSLPLARIIRGLSLVLLLACGGKEWPTEPVAFNVTPQGGTATLAGGLITLVVPAGAVTETTLVTAQAAVNPPASPLLVLGSAVDMEPAGLTFLQPLQLTVNYSGLPLPTGVLGKELRVDSATGGAWGVVPGSVVNTGNQTVTANIRHLGTFGLLGVAVASIVVTPASPNLVVGDTVRLKATPMDAASDTLPNRTVSWTSSAPAVATVDSTTGLVTAVAFGKAAITASTEGISATDSVVVTVPPTALGLTTQPSAEATSGVRLATQPVVQLLDASSNPVRSANVAVTASIATGGGTLGGNLTVNTNSSGVAAFTDLVITGSGTTTLLFSSSFSAVTSNIIVVSDPVACGNTGSGATITAISRDAGSAAGGATVRLTGTGFKATDCVTFGTTQASGVSLVNATTLEAIVPPRPVGLVSVSVVQNGVTFTLSNAFTYLPVPTKTYGSQAADGTLTGWTRYASPATPSPGASVSASADQTRGGRSKSIKGYFIGGHAGTGANGSFTRSDGRSYTSGDVRKPVNLYASSADGAALIGRFTVTSQTSTTIFFTGDATGAGWAYGPEFSGASGNNDIGYSELLYQFTGAEANPALNEANGIYVRWYQYVPTATISLLDQIKMMLFRSYAAGRSWYILALQNSVTHGSNRLHIETDYNTGDATVPWPDVFFGDGAWHEIQTWHRRTGGVGYAKVWVDGKLISTDTHAEFGSDGGTDVYEVAIGRAYSNNFGPNAIYVDNATIANGYIDP